MTTLLVVSPHLDDGVLSCGGTILRHAQRGGRVVVATVFSEGDGSAARRDEDRAALRSLGAEALHLGLVDAPERLRLPRSHRGLVEDAAVDPTDVTNVRSVLQGAIESLRPARILSPLGAGEHIDHRVVHAALHGRATVLYEDRPYAFLAGAVRARLAALGLQVDDASSVTARDLVDAPAAGLLATQLASLPHLRAYARDEEDRVGARAWLTSRVGATASRVSGRRASVTATVTAHDEEAAHAVVSAITLYASQVRDLFGAQAHVAAALRAAARALGAVAPHAERTFMVLPVWGHCGRSRATR